MWLETAKYNLPHFDGVFTNGKHNGDTFNEFKIILIYTIYWLERTW